MKPKQIEFGVQNKILNGVDKLYKAVASTLGPSGKNVIIDIPGRPFITKDGVTVAKYIALKDPIENIGAMMVKEVASKSNDMAGDGTTTATVLAHAFYKEGLKLVASGHNPIDVKREIDGIVDKIVYGLKDKAKNIDSFEDILKVSLVSTNNDPELGGYIAEAAHRVGVNGNILVENNTNENTVLEFVEGLQIQRGILSSFFINDINLTCTYKHPKVLICNFNLDSMDDLVPIMNQALKANEPLIILADAYEDNLFSNLLYNRKKQKMKLCCLHTPGSGDYKYDEIEDLALALGATIFYEDHGKPLKEATLDDLGSCEKMVSNGLDTCFISGSGDLKERIEELESAIASAEGHTKSRFQDRYSRLTSGVATLKVGAMSDTEMKDKKLRIEDGIRAVKSAMEEGILPGGGMALYHSRTNSNDLFHKTVNHVLEAPIREIVKNTGENVEEILYRLKNVGFEHGYDARKKEFGDMFELGVIDPLLVVRSSLQNAASVAGMLLTTDACIVVEDEKET